MGHLLPEAGEGNLVRQRPRFFADKGELRVQGVIYTARREKSSYVLELAGHVLARAERLRKWPRELVIEHSGRRYTLRAKSVFRRDFQLFDDSTQIGFVSPEGLFTRKAAVELPRTLPLFLQVFVIWLAMTLWKHEDAAAVA
jgi:hypothetical protein